VRAPTGKHGHGERAIRTVFGPGGAIIFVPALAIERYPAAAERHAIGFRVARRPFMIVAARWQRTPATLVDSVYGSSDAGRTRQPALGHEKFD
jgi:hypothetical protein